MDGLLVHHDMHSLTHSFTHLQRCPPGKDAAEEEAALGGTQESVGAQVLLELAARSLEHSGVSWWVGDVAALDRMQ